MKAVTRFSGATAPPPEAQPEAEHFDSTEVEDEVLAEAVRLAREPLSLEDDEPVTAAGVPTVSGDAFAIAAGVTAISRMHEDSTKAISAMVSGASTTDDAPVRTDEVVLEALRMAGRFAERPLPANGDIHVHTPQHDLRVNVEQPDFNPEITVESAKIDLTVPERTTQVDVHVPEQQTPQVNVTTPEPQVVVQAAAAVPPDIHVHMPDEIHTVPAETETVAERDDQDLIVRSITRPTGG